MEIDEEKVEHRTLGWRNDCFFNFELNEDIISIINKDGDKSKFSVGKASKQPNVDTKVGIINEIPSRHHYSEASYYYNPHGSCFRDFSNIG